MQNQQEHFTNPCWHTKTNCSFDDNILYINLKYLNTDIHEHLLTYTKLKQTLHQIQLLRLEHKQPGSSYHNIVRLTYCWWSLWNKNTSIFNKMWQQRLGKVNREQLVWNQLNLRQLLLLYCSICVALFSPSQGSHLCLLSCVFPVTGKSSFDIVLLHYIALMHRH